jgi:hypothetical protein
MPAFPGAMGFGANSVGGSGRGGAGTPSVYYVNTLADGAQAGTFRYACTQSGPRVIIFRVGGTITLTSTLTVSNPYYYIAGQTAPGGGIQIKNYGCHFGGHNGIVRFLRFRPGVDTAVRPAGVSNNACWAHGGTGSGAWDGTKAIGLNHDVIFDHCEFGWATDQQMDVYGNVTDVTYQNCIVAEAANLYNPENQPLPVLSSYVLGFGSLTGFEPYWGTPMRVSHIRNIYAHNRTRNPAVLGFLATSATLAPGIPAYTALPRPFMKFDLRNNLMYNWSGGQYAGSLSGGACYSQAHYDQAIAACSWPTGTPFAQYNVIGNHFRRGPSVNAGELNVLATSKMAKVYLFNNFDTDSGIQNGMAIGVNVVGNYPGDPDALLSRSPDINWPHATAQAALVNMTASSEFNFYGATYPAATTLPVGNVFTLLTGAGGAGCSQVFRSGSPVSIRDAASTRIINDILNQTGLAGGAIQTVSQWNSGVNFTYPTIASGVPYTDSNLDGIQDGWAGLPSGATAHQVSPTGYTYLENFLNEMAGDSVSTPSDTTPPAAPTGVFVSKL